MTITINLDQIILEGIDIPPSQRPRLRVVVEEELSRLLQEKGIPRQLYKGTAIACLSATIKVTKEKKETMYSSSKRHTLPTPPTLPTLNLTNNLTVLISRKIGITFWFKRIPNFHISFRV